MNTAWIRLVTPREDDTNRSRWDTDPIWRVVQSPTFTDAPAPARRMVRRTQRSHDVEKLVAAQYGYLVSFVSAQYPEGEQWDVSRAVRVVADALASESEKPAKDFGQLVRERRKERGLAVLPAEPALPYVSLGVASHDQDATRTDETALETAQAYDGHYLHDGHCLHDGQGIAYRVQCAEQRMAEAYAALEYGTIRQLAPQALAGLEATFNQACATYAAACALHEQGLSSAGFCAK